LVMYFSKTQEKNIKAQALRKEQSIRVSKFKQVIYT
jgi:hypothetical protein